jgi:hypothetical protein
MGRTFGTHGDHVMRIQNVEEKTIKKRNDLGYVLITWKDNIKLDLK